MIKRVIMVLVMFIFICSSAVSEKSQGGLYVSASGDLQPGWYTATPASGKWSKMTIVDVLSFDVPKVVASYEWFPDGDSLLSDCREQPDEYTFPLWEGCFVLFSYYGNLEYDKSTGELNWTQLVDSEGIQFGDASLKYVAPFERNEVDDTENADKSLLLYEDEKVKITHLDFRVKTYGDKSYTKIEWLIENKTDETVDVSCVSITVNGCAVDISKFCHVPPKSKYINEWTNSAELFMKFGLSEFETFSAVISVEHGRDIQTAEIQIR